MWHYDIEAKVNAAIAESKHPIGRILIARFIRDQSVALVFDPTTLLGLLKNAYQAFMNREKRLKELCEINPSLVRSEGGIDRTEAAYLACVFHLWNFPLLSAPSQILLIKTALRWDFAFGSACGDLGISWIQGIEQFTNGELERNGDMLDLVSKACFAFDPRLPVNLTLASMWLSAWRCALKGVGNASEDINPFS